MTALEKLAWAAEQAHNGPPHSLNIDYIAIARAVISSIEVDDAMVEVAKAAYLKSADVESMDEMVSPWLVPAMRAALTASLRSLTEGEK